jgi:NAD(P)-dependent dehydrogenase (short-subunit alcohol dehydrogenase family)
MAKVWLVTGSARGLGRKIVEAALAAGERVVATARNPRDLADLVERYGEQVRAVALDVTDSAAARAAVDDFRAQIDTNFYGVVNVTRAALPTLRKQRSGHIIQISSVGGRLGMPGFSAYQSAKWAVGGFTEVLSQELAPLGIKVTALEPGGMKTEWGNEAGGALPELLEDYAASVGAIVELLGQHVGNETSDPVKVAQVVLKLAYHEHPPAHLLLGSDALHFFGEADKARNASAAAWRDVSLATDFAAPAALPDFPQS